MHAWQVEAHLAAEVDKQYGGGKGIYLWTKPEIEVRLGKKK
jgi:hypothetical protein